MLLLNDRQKEERKGKKKRKEEGCKQEAKMKRNQSDKVKKERTATIQLENKNKKMTINFIMLNFREACLALMVNFVILRLRNRAFRTSYFEFLKVDKWVDFPFLWNINANTTTTSREFLKIEGRFPS